MSSRGPLVRFAEGVFCMTADETSLERPRRMTVLASPDGRLAVHSGIRLPEDELRAIDALGPVSWYLLTPNPNHDPDAAWFAARYPKARFLCAAAEAERFRELTRVDATFETELPPGLDHHTVEGTRFTETVFFHQASRTLVLVDLAFHITRASLVGRPFARLFWRANGAFDRFGITRLTSMLVSDARALRRSLERILTWDFERVVVSHGQNVERDGKLLFRAGFPRYLPAT